MTAGTSCSRSALNANNTKLQTTHNNIANMQTYGYKQNSVRLSEASPTQGHKFSLGAGVRVSDIAYDFKQGSLSHTGNDFDLAIDGQGFFCVQEQDSEVALANGTFGNMAAGPRAYTRAGKFELDKHGFLVNSSNSKQKLVGFMPDAEGNITGSQGLIRIDKNTSIPPKATTGIVDRVSLNNRAVPPKKIFDPNFSPANPPPQDSFNWVQDDIVAYDSKGFGHKVSLYYVKSPFVNVWQVYVGLDGYGVNPEQIDLPLVGTAQMPLPLEEINTPIRPFTLVFDSSGNLVQNDGSKSMLSYGLEPIISSSFATDLVDEPLSLIKPKKHDLIINDQEIDLDKLDEKFSAAQLADAINAKTEQHKVTAIVMPTTITFDQCIYNGNTNLSGTDFVINGVAITGSVSNSNDLASLINNKGITGLSATVLNEGHLSISLLDGGNLTITSSTIFSSEENNLVLNASSFPSKELLNLGAVNDTKFDEVFIRGQIQLQFDESLSFIDIAGNDPGLFGLRSGVLNGIKQNYSDTISLKNLKLFTGAEPLNLEIDLSGSVAYSEKFSSDGPKVDGNAVGDFKSAYVDSQGVIQAQYSNGKLLALGQVALANFKAESGLISSGDSCFLATLDSGDPRFGAPGSFGVGSINSGSIEESNVVASDVLVELMEVQRNINMNTQGISVHNKIIQDILSMTSR